MTREEHVYQLEQYLKGHLISMCPSSSSYWKEHYKEVIELLKQDHLPEKCKYWCRCSGFEWPDEEDT